MSVATTLKVVLKGEDWGFYKKYLVYEAVTLNEECETVQKCLDDAKDCLKVTADDAEFKISQVVRGVNFQGRVLNVVKFMI